MKMFIKNLFLVPALISGLGLMLAGQVTAQTFTTLHTFYGGDGANPEAGLILSGNTLYGTTESGGSSGGTVFSINTDGSDFTNLYDFTGGNDGVYPTAGFVLSGNTLYGTTYGMPYGSVGQGTVFRINTDGSGFTNLHIFTAVGYQGELFTNSDGAYPAAGFVLLGNTLYGTTVEGGASGDGTVFSINTDGSGFTDLHTFGATYIPGFDINSDGANPHGGLAISGNTLYGTTENGGTNGNGTVFAISADGSGFRSVYAFDNWDIAPNVTDPQCGLILSGHTLYGTTFGGGNANKGTVFAVNTDGTGLTKLHGFAGSDGANPQAGLILSGSTLYGTTEYGGSSGDGTVFSINTDGSGFTNLYVFTGGGDGANPYGGLVLSGNTLYGTTMNRGNTWAVGTGDGTVFSLSLESVSPGQGSLQVTMTPSGAVSAGAQWQVDAGTYQNSDATVTNLSVGAHTVWFTPISGWNTPAPQTVTITNGATTTASGVYTIALPGALSVTLLPAGAVSAGAQWQVDGGTNQNTGVTVTNLSAGNHLLSFTPISGWTTPADQPVTITSGATTTASGVYTVALSGALSVTLLPAGAVSAGAAWRVDSGTNQNSGATVTHLSTGSHTLSFTTISGWNTPPNQVVTITSGVTTTASGIYTPTNAPSNGLTLLTNGAGTIQHGAWPKSLVIEKKYTVTAAPKPRNVFVNWVGGTAQPYSVLSLSASYKFTMQPNLVLEANFVTNVFLAAQGTYRGLFAPTNSARQQAESGLFSFTVASSRAVSGSLALGGQTVPLSGKFSLGGAADIVSKRPHGEPPLTTTLQLDFADQSVTGAVSNGAFTAQLNGDRAVFSSSHKATQFEGQYTLIIPGTNDPTVGPFGVSYGTVKVGPLGTITLAGSLADGTAISQSSVVSKDGSWPLYVNLYGGKGSLWGWNYFAGHTITAAPVLSWINATNSSKTAVYRSGFTNQAATLTGGLYLSTSTLPSDLTATLEGGGLPIAITNGVTISANDKIALTNSVDETNKLKLTVSKSTGVISGSFANPARSKQTIKVNGAILPGETNAQGYFLGTNQSGAFTLDTP